MKKEVIVAIIGAIATIFGAFIAATEGARETVKNETASIIREIERLDVVTAGSIKSNGKVEHYSGYPFTVFPVDSGVYRVNFRDPFKNVPVVVAIGDGGESGAIVEVTSIDITGFTIEGRTYSEHGLAPTGFQFIAVNTNSSE
ncbi:hypothetical protein KFE80_03170 [bacterium SCSIO 12696]|nr:hypothetical protein KFE80_03170 [bacterium SCSIO 12696]